MSIYDAAFLNTELSKPTSIFGLRLWVVIGIFLGSLIVLALFLLSLCLTSRRKNRKLNVDPTAIASPPISKEIQEIVHHHQPAPDHHYPTPPVPEIQIVYSGVLADGTRVAVKNLLNNRGQAEREFKVEVEVIGRVRHKNLVRLLGYCVEGAYRMLVYEYVDNGNLDQWLHGDVGEVSPLTWDVRINVILGTAKGLAYLHEGLEPKVVHRDVKSSNILLDRHWHPKVSDFGLAKLLCSERSYVTTRVMGTFGYVAPEYACTGMLNEKSDVYSFGILIMEIISGRNPVDYSRPQGEVNLVDWLKTMVGNRKSEEVVDPKLPEMPASKALKRVLLVALRCVDPDATKRPKMGHVIHMLEADDLLFRDERRIGREPSNSHCNDQQASHTVPKLDNKRLDHLSSDTSEGDSSRGHHQPARWR
ncbi:probable serine/threonine-protein kinase At1g01540 [Carica papaya]|uniref:probable serine/threonine-protein kinase At1g01540 n=1 Tax=Carica papaya TaxID=3649 RepID=UPI000B8CFF25|nr:probable serine/threonine-protein kinase At1g01540 [Carica papaya]